MEEILAAARSVDWRALGDRSVCDSCLGRLFGKLEHGLANAERGGAVREIAGIAGDPCWVCGGLTARYDDLAVLVARKLDPWEFETFRIGSKIDFELAAREESLWAELALTGPEPIKAEVNREVGKRVSDLVRKEAALDSPDVVAVVDTGFDHVDLQVNPLYLRGRYRKLSRGVPQTRWPCRRCRGKGCPRCGGTGKMYPTSGEEAKLKGTLPALVGEPIAQRTPGRVVHRRADTTRARRLLSAEVIGVEGDRAELRVTAEAGTYIKEWVHGDGGRTRPSLAERLGAACEVLELDVLDVHDGG